jgi:hypothetical protein
MLTRDNLYNIPLLHNTHNWLLVLLIVSAGVASKNTAKHNINKAFGENWLQPR